MEEYHQTNSAVRSRAFYLFLFCYSITLSGSGQQNVREMEPAISPDGTKIAFRGIVGSNSDIYIMNIDGTEPVRITTNQAAEGLPFWSPDGKQLAFYSNRDGNIEIYTKKLPNGKSIRRTNDPGLNLAGFWLGDNQHLYYTTDANGGAVHKLNLLNGSDGIWSTAFEHHHAIEYITSADAIIGVAVNGKDWEIVRADVDGNGLEVVSPHAARDSGPRLSPDGQFIAFTSKRGSKGNWQLFIMNADGNNVRQLTMSEGRRSSAQWMPSGRILFGSNDENGSHLYLINRDGTGMEKLEIGW